MRPRSTCTRVMERGRVWRRKGTAHDPKHTTSSVKHGGGSVMAWACMAASGTGSLCIYCMWLLTKQAGWILKCFGQYYLLIFSQMLQNALDGASQCRWTMTQSILQKQPKSFWRERSGLLCKWPSQSPDLNRLSMHFTCWRQNWRENAPRTSRELKTVASRGLAEHHQGWNPASGDVYAFQTSAVIDCKGFATSIKKWKFDSDYYSVPLLLVP